MNDLRETLLQCGKELNPSAREAIVAAGPDAVPRLLEVLADPALHDIDGPGDGWAPIHAATLLGELRAPEAVQPLLAAFEHADWDEYLKDCALLALHKIGAPALEATLQALASAVDDEQRDDLCAVLGDLGVRDERAFQHLAAQLSRDPQRGAMELAGYGDARALPLLFEALDRHAVELNAFRVDPTLIELGAAVEALGGQLRPEHEAKFALMDHLRREAIARAAADREGPVQALRRERPGRNDPCWCGSDKKYKKCHLDKDEARG